MSAAQTEGLFLRMTYATITGIGAYLPERRLTNFDLETMVDTSDEWISTRTGIRERRMAAEGETTASLGAHAALAALRDAGLTSVDLDLIVLGTSSQDYLIPSTASVVQSMIGATCPAVDVLAACTSFIYGLHYATTAIESGRAKRVLVVGADLLTRFVDFTDRTTCVLFGDGAGAVVVEAADEPGILGIDLGAEGVPAEVLTIPAGGDDQHIHMLGGEVFKFAVRVIPETTQRALEASDLTIDDVTWLVPHQANQRIIVAAAERLGMEPDKVFSNIEVTGNTSAASIPLALNDLYTDGQLHPGDVLALVGFGSGLTWGGAIVRWTKGQAQ